jgi:hypothetical protein
VKTPTQIQASGTFFLYTGAERRFKGDQDDDEGKKKRPKRQVVSSLEPGRTFVVHGLRAQMRNVFSVMPIINMRESAKENTSEEELNRRRIRRR